MACLEGAEETEALFVFSFNTSHFCISSHQRLMGYRRAMARKSIFVSVLQPGSRFRGRAIKGLTIIKTES